MKNREQLLNELDNIISESNRLEMDICDLAPKLHSLRDRVKILQRMIKFPDTDPLVEKKDDEEKQIASFKAKYPQNFN